MVRFSLGESEFRRLRDLIQARFGIDLGPEKKELIVTRLQSVLKRRGLADFRAYLEFLERSEGTDAFSELVDRISTNHTFFHREPSHFDFFRSEVLPQLVGRERAPDEKDLRIWCAASSTGEEPYTIVMAMLDVMGESYSAWKAGLLATDLSSDVLERAAAGVYTEENVSRLPKGLRDAYFERIGDGRFRVCARVRREVVFRRFNLIQDRYAFKRPFHVVFCRNVMIYFDADTQRRVLERIHGVMNPGGLLYVGHSENFGDSRDLFRLRGKTVYEHV